MGPQTALEAVNLPNTVTASGTVDFNLASVWGELLGGVFCRDTALEGETACGNVVLSQAKLLKRGTGRNLDLSGDDIDTSDLLGDGVLNLDTGVDLNKVVPMTLISEACSKVGEGLPVLLVDQELGSTSVAVLDGLSEPDGISQDGVAGLDGKILGGSNLNDLLVATLH